MPRPNVLIVYTDQQRYDTLGCNGNAYADTPNLDAFARRGLRITRAHVTCPICVPSRIALHTGRYNHSTRRYNNSEKLPDDERAMPGVFREAGYRTAMFGKDHCFKAGQRADNWDRVKLATHFGVADAQAPAALKHVRFRAGAMYKPTAMDPVCEEESITAQVFGWAGEFIAEQAQAEESRPFFAWVSIPDPHPPYMVSPDALERYRSFLRDSGLGPLPDPAQRDGEFDNKPARQQLMRSWGCLDEDYPNREALDELRVIYAAMVSQIDRAFGALMGRLDALGLTDDTIVVFTSDHGDYMGDHGLIRKSPQLYQALTHVPLLMRWGDRFASADPDQLVANIDLFPTLCGLCGVTPPQGVQGLDLSKALVAGPESGPSTRDALFLEAGDYGDPLCWDPNNPPPHGEGKKPHVSAMLGPEFSRGRARGVVWSHYKYVYNLGEVDELYDLESDPNELTNRADDPALAKVVRQGRDKLLDWAIRTQDRNPLNTR